MRGHRLEDEQHDNERREDEREPGCPRRLAYDADGDAKDDEAERRQKAASAGGALHPRIENNPGQLNQQQPRRWGSAQVLEAQNARRIGHGRMVKNRGRVRQSAHHWTGHGVAFELPALTLLTLA